MSSRSDLWNKLKKLNPNTKIQYRTSTISSLKKDINNIRRKQISFKNELKQEVKKFQKYQTYKRELKNVKDFFNNPLENKTITINKSQFRQYKAFMKFYPEYKLLETDGNEFRVRKQNDNFNYKRLITQETHESDYDIEYNLLTNKKDFLTASWVKKQERRNGAFFPYYNNSKIDLSEYQIYFENQKTNNLNCLQQALKEGGLDEKEFIKLLTLFIKNNDSCNLSHNDYIPKCKLKQIAEFFNIIIELSYERKEDNRCRIEKFGTKGKIYKIGLLCNHYFINKETEFTKKDFGIINKSSHHYSKLTSFKLIQLLLRSNTPCGVLEYKDTLLIPMTYHNNKSAYDFDDLKNYQTLYEPKKCTCDINIDGIDEIKYLRESFCNSKCGAEIKLIQGTGQKIPNIFYVKKEKKYVDFEFGYFDFEATTNGDKHKAYQIAYKNRNGEKSFFEGEYCAINFLKSLKTHTMLFAHNLKYDLQFIIQYLCKHEGFIKTGSQFKTISGEFYNKDTKQYIKLCFKDSMSVIPESLSKFGEMFKLEQTKEILPYGVYTEDAIKLLSIPIDYAKDFLSDEDYIDFKENIKKWNLELPNNHFNHMKYSKIYCEMDVEVLSQGYEKMKEWMYEITQLDLDFILSLPQLAYKFGVNQNVFNDCFSLAGQAREFIQRCLVGGRTMTRDNKKWHTTEKLQDFDGVSLYPSAMVEMEGVLKGTPKVIQTNQLNLEFLNTVDGYFVEVDILDINIKRHFPLLSQCNKGQSRNFSNDIRGSVYLDKVSLEDAIKFQDIKFKIIRGYYYNEGRNNIINDFMKYLFNERLIKKKEKNPIQQCYKLIMNSFYGKTIQNPIYKNYKFIYGKEKSIKSFLFNTATMICATKISDELFMLEEHNPIHQHFSLPHIGIEILSMSKRIMNRVMCLAEDLNIKIYYQDTDSMHIEDDKIDLLALEFKKKYDKELIGENLGQFHCDFDFKSKDKLPVAIESYFLGKKCYIDKILCVNDKVETIEYHCRMKGVPSKCIKKFQCKNLDTNSYYINVLDIYKDLYNKETIEFELVDKKCFKYNKNFSYSKYDNDFKRKIKF